MVRADPGRKQTHFYGAVNLVSGKEIVMRSEVMISEVSAQLLQAILDSEPDVPIVVFWDRAPWHRGEKVKKLLESNPRLQLICFPTASPDLNPQEHVWKLLARQSVTTTRFLLCQNWQSVLKNS
jgi:transposase